MNYRNLKLSEKFDKFIFVWSAVYLLAVSAQKFLNIDTKETENLMLIFKYIYPMVIFVYWAYDNNYKLKYGIAFLGACLLFAQVILPILTILVTILVGNSITVILLTILLIFCPFFLSAFYQFFKILSYTDEEKKKEMLKNTEKSQEIEKTAEIKEFQSEKVKELEREESKKEESFSPMILRYKILSIILFIVDIISLKLGIEFYDSFLEYFVKSEAICLYLTIFWLISLILFKTIKINLNENYIKIFFNKKIYFDDISKFEIKNNGVIVIRKLNGESMVIKHKVVYHEKMLLIVKEKLGEKFIIEKDTNKKTY